jgi:hypothetical protein
MDDTPEEAGVIFTEPTKTRGPGVCLKGGPVGFLVRGAYLPAMSSLSSRTRQIAANDNSPPGAGGGLLSFWWPVIAAWALPPIVTLIGVVAALCWTA